MKAATRIALGRRRLVLALLGLLRALAGAGALGPDEAAAGRDHAQNDGSGPG